MKWSSAAVLIILIMVFGALIAWGVWANIIVTRMMYPF